MDGAQMEDRRGWHRQRNMHRVAGLGHMNCFLVSGSKVLESMGDYVVVAIWMKDFTGQIMMGLSIFIFLEWLICGIEWHNAMSLFAFVSALRTDTEHTIVAQVDRSRWIDR